MHIWLLARRWTRPQGELEVRGDGRWRDEGDRWSDENETEYRSYRNAEN